MSKYILKKVLRAVRSVFLNSAELSNLEGRLEEMQAAIGRIELRQIKMMRPNEIENAEFKVFSQWGEDGIIQYLLDHVPIKNKVFIEIGVQDYKESNTRFLLKNNNWEGVLIDASKEDIQSIKDDVTYWKYSINAIHSFITRENINEVIQAADVPFNVGLLSIDIDGNDYWVWDAIECISPVIVICEYNNLFGPDLKVTVPYKSDFERSDAHYSNLYYGASISALQLLAKNKGYILVGSNSVGTNIFFVRNDMSEFINSKTVSDTYVKCNVRESRSKSGELTFLSKKEALKEINECTLHDLEAGKIRRVKSLFVDN